MLLMIALAGGALACGSVSGKGRDAAIEPDTAITGMDTAGTTPDTGAGGGAGSGGDGDAGGDHGGVDSGTVAIELVEGAVVSLGNQASATGVTLESDGFELADQACSTDGTVCMVGGIGP